MAYWECYRDFRGPNGPKGPKGKSIGTQAEQGKSGSAGNYTNKDLNLDSQRKKYTYSFFKMMLHDAELDYLNNRPQKAAEKLIWLNDLLESGQLLAGEAADIVQQRYDTNLELSQHIAILERIHVLLTQLSQGLNFYGHFPNFVPLTSVSTYEAVIDGMIILATDIEDAFSEYYEDHQNSLKQRKAINRAVSTLTLKNEQLEAHSNQIILEVNKTREHVANLLDEEIVLEKKVNEARHSFQNAVSREAACGFDDVIKAASAIAAVASGIGSIAGGLAAVAQMQEMIDNKKLKDKLKDKAEYLTKKIQIVGAGIDGISKGYLTVKEILEKERDGAKLIAAEEDFKSVVERFEHLPEAREYGNLMRQYLNVIKTRNNKILEIDSKITKILELETEKNQLAIELASTRGRLLEVSNPRLAEHVVFFDRAVNRIKADLLRAIIMEHKALEYWGLRPSLVPSDIQDRSVAQLKNYQFMFKDKLLKLKEERNAVPLKISPAKLLFARENLPEAYEVFDQTGRFSFSISHNHPSYRFYARTFVNTANVSIATSEMLEGWAWIFLRHHGNATFVDTLGKLHSFSHRGRDRAKELPPGEHSVSIELGGQDGKYAFLSPFATWAFMMEFGNEANDDILTGDDEIRARKKITEIAIRFEGIADSRYGHEGMAISMGVESEMSINFEPDMI